MTTLTARATQIDPPLLSALKRGQISIALELLNNEQTMVDATDSQGLNAIHWACFLRQNAVIKTLLTKNCRLDQGPQPSALYEATIENGDFIFERAKKDILPDGEPFSQCIPDALLHVNEICTNLKWNGNHNPEIAFWKNRETTPIDLLILLDLKKVATTSYRNIHRFFKSDITIEKADTQNAAPTLTKPSS